MQINATVTQTRQAMTLLTFYSLFKTHTSNTSRKSTAVHIRPNLGSGPMLNNNKFNFQLLMFDINFFMSKT